MGGSSAISMRCFVPEMVGDEMGGQHRYRNARSFENCGMRATDSRGRAVHSVVEMGFEREVRAGR